MYLRSVDILISEVKQNFSFPEYREKQEATLEALVDAFQQKDCVILEAPTGSGKSALIMALAKYYDSAYISTPQKALQQQYMDDFGDDDLVVEMRGRSNYICVFDKNFNCKTALCQKKDSFDCPEKERCVYLMQKEQAIRSPITVLNFAYLLSEGMIPRTGEGQLLMDYRRDLLVVDEGHGLIDFAQSFVDLTLSFRNMPQSITSFPFMEDISDVKKFLRKLYAEYEVWQAKFSQPYNDEEQEEIDKIEKQKWKIRHFFAELEDGKEWIFTVRGKGKYKKLVLKPAFISDFVRENVWSRGDKILISSASIIDEHSFMREVGLDTDDVVYISVPMTFCPENRPIYYTPVGKMTRAEQDETFPYALDKIAEVVMNHENERGLIHCHSYKRLEKIYDNFCGVERFLFHGRGNRDEKFNDWIKKGHDSDDNTVFVSAGFSEGIDLYDDLCRFQILLKIPYPYLGDVRTSYRVNQLDMWKWYNVRTARKIIQSYGRAVRSKDDYADFYIIDESYDRLKKRFKYLFPDWFLEAEN